ncbi:ABC transporter permease [Gulosibacter faecalis]|jgi:peptide/nickel transport system permease protein|uniref:ABC transporter permease n=1 Tax=Gulosibacter faecalis TaxID=272240 RepID=A0ABW5UZR5_9MICO|nr:ABC transporter permease [Gulosibacter faecalis]
MTDLKPKFEPAIDAGGTEAILTTKASRRQRTDGRPGLFALLLRDKFATVAAVVLILIVFTSLIAPLLVTDLAQRPDLPNRNLPPFSVGEGWQFILGSDAIGRSMFARMMLAGGTSLGVSFAAVVVACIIGTAWGIWAGYHRGWRENVSMRIGDIIMSFPSLLLAVVVLYIFAPSAANIVLVLAITRIPIYLRTARAESAELRTRMFVDAARNFGSSPATIMGRHVFPNVLPTIVSLATLEFCFVMLAESSLSFLGIGIQPPDLSWGLMVAQGREYLQVAWWQSVLPGLMIVITTVCANILAQWLRIATDPGQRWRLANK